MCIFVVQHIHTRWEKGGSIGGAVAEEVLAPLGGTQELALQPVIYIGYGVITTGISGK